MSVLMVPDDGDVLWPTLGPQVADFIETYLVFGPGDLRGQPAVLDDEKRALLYRMYEVFPQDHPLAGRRRFQRVGISLAKGLAKTEFAAWIAACELHPDAPVRTIGWNERGEPIGGPVTDPYIPMVAYTEEQSDELAYGALKAILEESPVADDFDIGLERIMRIGGDGRAVSLASSPSARDGARTTFQIADETHWWTAARLKRAHQTMMNNLPKRREADAWALEVTTAPEPGAGSVAEDTMEYAKAIADGRIKNARLFYFHRQASDKHDLTTEEGARAAVIEATGPAVSWRNVEGVMELWRDPTTDRSYWERVWCNRLVQSAEKAFDVMRWRELKRDDNPVKPGDLIVLGFDGSQFHDATALVATHVTTGHQWIVGLWERPTDLAEGREWQVPVGEVDDAVREMFDRYDVWRMYADPPYWQTWIAQWAGEHGEKRVVEWYTNRRRAMSHALQNFETAIKAGDLSHNGDPDFERHIANAHKQELNMRDERGQRLWLIRKERPDSPQKIDAAMAAVLSWEARTHAVASGVTETVNANDYITDEYLDQLGW